MRGLAVIASQPASATKLAWTGAPAGISALALAALALLLPGETHGWVLAVILGLGALSWAGGAGGWPAGAGTLGLFLGSCLVAAVGSPLPAAAADRLVALAAAASLLVLVNRADRRAATALLAAVAVVHGVLAAWQRWVLLPALAGQLGDGGDPLGQIFVQRASGARAYSTFALPGHLAALLAGLAPVLVAEAGASSPAWLRMLAWAGLGGVALGLYCSAGLGGALVLGLVGLPALWRSAVLSRRARTALLGIGLLAVCGVLLVRAPDLLDPSRVDNPLVPRLRMWRRALSVIASSPVRGVGLGAYPVAWLPFAQPGDVPARNAHMSYLEIAAECGLPALALLALFLWQALRAAGPTGWTLGAVVLLLHATGDFDLQSPGLLCATFVLLGLAVRPANPAPRSRAGSWAGVALLGGLAVLGAARARGQPAPRLPGEDPRERLAMIERCLAAWPWDGRLHGERAAALLSAGRLDEALAELERARHFEPRSPWLASLEADLRVRRGEAVLGYFAWREAARLEPARPEPAASALELQGLLEAARRRPAANGAGQ